MHKSRIHRRSPRADDQLPPQLHPVLRRVLCNRGVGSAEQIDLGLDRLLPLTGMKGLDAATDLLVEAIQHQWRICVVGDYDADGATSTALMVTVLRLLGAGHVDYLVPDRFKYGYGLSREIVELAVKSKPDLLITVDNGISSHAGVTAAREAGIRVLITDHHLPGRTLPEAAAIVNPNQPGCAFPSKALAGVGVAFYLLLALRARLREGGCADLPNMAAFLDLVALGTVADVVPLDHNNRILVAQGLKLIRSGHARPGIYALLSVAGRDLSRLSSSDLGFAVGPRLNAAGRLDDMTVGIECLLAADDDQARALAIKLDQLNRERREIQQQMQDEAMTGLEERLNDAESLPAGICLYDAGWHQGITGLVAGKVKDKYHRPVVAFAPADDGAVTLKGSARSIRGFHVRDALDAIASHEPGLIEKFGGHAMAAGLSIEARNLDRFRLAFEQEARRLLDQDALQGRIESDGELADEEFSLPVAIALQASGPWGQSFPEPLFDGVFEVLESRIVGERHLKLKLQATRGGAIQSAIAFNQPEGARSGQKIHAAYRLVVNDFRGSSTAEAVIEWMEGLD